jgi:CheY-like chemotaxis protein
VLNNLVSNAIKFTPSGEVCVRAAAVGDGAGSVRFEVTDTGIGISADARPRIFQPFAQADESIARRYGGTGLGLAIAARLVAAMGGAIDVESGPGGSRFWFTVPLGTAPLDLPLPIHLPSRRVLVVAADDAQRRSLLEEIGRWGMCADAAGGADAAVAELLRAAGAGRRYDTVLLVVEGEVREGAELTRALHVDRRVTPPPGIALLVSQGRGGDAVAACEAGAVTWLAAPLRPVTLAGHLSRWPAAAVPAAGRRSLTPPGRILVVDDSEVVREVMAEMLQGMGQLCETVGSGQGALDALQRQRFDLVFLDCQMPEMDGFDTAQRIRAAEAGSATRTPIVAFSAGAAEIYRERCLRAEMDDCLAKPIRPAALADILARWLRPAVVPQPGMTGVLDRQRLAALAGDSASSIQRYCALFLPEARDVIREITQAADGGDARALGPKVHRLRGAAVFIGAVRFEKSLALLQVADASPAALQALAYELTVALDGFEHSVQALLHELAAHAQ